MDAELLAYYQSELAYLREQGAEFARDYPKVAGRLALEADRCDDPHVERLLEGFAFLAGRVRRKIDDEFPEISQALLELLYPHSLRPVPSMSIVQLLGGPDAPGGSIIPAGVELTSRPIRGVPCRFRTAYPVTLWPVEVESARIQHDRLVLAGKPADAVALLEIRLRREGGVTRAQPPIGSLRFFVDGEASIAHAVHASLLNHACGIAARGTRADGSTEVVPLPNAAIRAVGFGADEGMFPYPSRSFPGYRLLQEFFAFPEKFLFFDFEGLGGLAGRPWGDSVDLLVFLDKAPRGEVVVDAENFRLGCTPIVNLFSKVVEPIPLTRHKTEYRVVPDVHLPLATEIFEIESVVSTASMLDEPVRYEPLYRLKHGEAPGPRAYWQATRRPSSRKGDPGTEVFVTLTEPGLRPVRRNKESLTVRAMCTNRDLASRLPIVGDGAEFELAAAGPVSRVRALRRPTPSLRAGLGRGAHWRLVSHLSLNHLSLVDGSSGPEALRALLRLYDPADSAVSRQQIEGISAVSSERVAGRAGGPAGMAACRGLKVTVEFDESQFVGGGMFLLASVLERFFAAYCSINSFTQLVARTRQPEAILKRWPPRSGDRTLL